MINAHTKNDFIALIDYAETFAKLDKIVKVASDCETITNAEYCEIYDYAIKKYHSWD